MTPTERSEIASPIFTAKGNFIFGILEKLYFCDISNYFYESMIILVNILKWLKVILKILSLTPLSGIHQFVNSCNLFLGRGNRLSFCLLFLLKGYKRNFYHINTFFKVYFDFIVGYFSVEKIFSRTRVERDWRSLNLG